MLHHLQWSNGIDRIPKNEVLAGLLDLLSKPTFIVQPSLLDLLARDGLASANPGFIDRLILAEYTANGLPLVTFEKTAKRLAGTQVL